MNSLKFTAGLTAILVISTFCFAVDDTITLRAGSELHVQLITTLSSKANDTDDFWTSKVVEPIFGNGGEIVPDGSTVDGHIKFVKSPGQEKGKGEMQLIVDSITTPDGSKYNVTASLESTQESKVKDEGTGIMAAMARRFSKKGKNIELPQGTEITFAISRETTAKKVPVRQ